MSMSNQSNPLNPTFEGHIASTVDALCLFEACLSGQLTHVPRRPHDRERQDLIKSGNVFIYEEHASGIKRWTDGVSWSPSRILGNFLIYRELEKPFPPGEKKRALKKTKKMQQGVSKSDGGARPGMGYPSSMDPHSGVKDPERSLIGSLIDSYPFKENGLVKKTISITFQGVPHHLVSYYNVADVMAGRLETPTRHTVLRDSLPRHELMMQQNFRAPIDDVEFSTDERFGGHPMYGGMPVGEYPGGTVLQRAMSLPSYNPQMQMPQPFGGPAAGYAFAQPTAPHPMAAEQQQQHHHQQPQPPQHPFVGSVPPPLSPLAYAPPTQGNYALDPVRPNRYAANATMAHEFPRNMPTNGPESGRRHSTFEIGPSGDIGSISMAQLPEGRAMTGTPYLQNPSYFGMPSQHRQALPEQDANFPSPRTLKSETDNTSTLVADDDATQHYGLAESAAWNFDNMDGSQDQQYFDGDSSEPSQTWPNGHNSLGRN